MLFEIDDALKYYFKAFLFLDYFFGNRGVLL